MPRLAPAYFAALAAALVFLLPPAARSSAPQTFIYNQSLPPRLQWTENGGYCGEVSTVAAGLRFTVPCCSCSCMPARCDCAAGGASIFRSTTSGMLQLAVNSSAH
jgi:uncharacterized membrane protein YraQ (UPF0718 family)